MSTCFKIGKQGQTQAWLESVGLDMVTYFSVYYKRKKSFYSSTLFSTVFEDALGMKSL